MSAAKKDCTLDEKCCKMDDGRNDNEKPVLKCELKEKDIKKDTYCEYSDSVK